MKKHFYLFFLAILPLMASAYDAKIGGIYYNFNSKSKTATVTSGDNKYTGNVIIPSTVTRDSISSYKVTSVGDNTFSYCDSLYSVTIPSSVTSLGVKAFMGCSRLTSVTIPDSVTYIGYNAFSYCSSLTEITIPNGVTSIGTETFRSCSNLRTVTIPNSVTTINNNAFQGCSGLSSVTIPDSVTYIGTYAFAWCSGLEEVTIPNNVTDIGEFTFYGCSSLTSITIPNSVTWIGNSSFSGCPKLADVYCYAKEISFTYSNAFNNSNTDNATLHVPSASIETYKATTPWSSFGSIIALDADPATQQITSASLTYTFNGRDSVITCPASSFETLDLTGTKAENFKIDEVKVQTSGEVRDVYIVAAEYRDGTKQEDFEINYVPLTSKGNGVWELSMGDEGWIVKANNRSTATRYLRFYFVANKDSEAPIYYDNDGNHYIISFYTKGGGGDQSGDITFYDENTAELYLKMSGGMYSNIPYTFNGDGTRDFEMNPGEVSSLQIAGFTLRLQRSSANVEIESVSVQYKVFEESSDGQWNTLNYTFQEDEDNIILNKKYTGTSATENLAEGLTSGKTYILQVKYQVIDQNGKYYFFTPSSWYGDFRFSIKESIEPGPEFIQGDVNGDGIVNGTDIQAIINLIVADLYDVKADVNKDGMINGTDIQKIINIIVYGPEKEEDEDEFLSCPNDKHPHLIDLGLPSGTKWACCNIEASKPEECGGYYCWGETESKTGWHHWDNYAYYDEATGTCKDLGNIAGTQYDVAFVKWGGSWRMPTLTQCYEFNQYCSSEWVVYNEQSGRIFTGPNGKKIFIPAAGYYWDYGIHDEHTAGYLWTSTPNEENLKYAYDLYFKEDEESGVNSYGYCNRYDGRSVRAVQK